MDNKWLLAFTKAWELLISLPMPFQLCKHSENNTDDDNEILVACFPIVGAVIGLSLFIVAWAVTILLPVKIAASLIGGLLLAISAELLLSGGNILTLTAYFQARQSACSGFETVTILDAAANSKNPQVNQIYMLSLYLLKIISISIFIYYDRIHWIIIVYTLSFLVRSQMLYWNDIRTGEPFFEFKDDENNLNLPWIISAIICFFVAGFSYLPASAIAMLISYFLLKLIKKIIDKKIGGVSGSIISAAGTFSEIILFLAGLALLIRE